MKTLLPVILLMLVGCQQMVVDVDVPHAPPGIVANVIAATDSTWKATLFASEYILDDIQAKRLTDGNVTIREANGNVIDLRYDGVRSFRNRNSRPMEGQTYHMTVSVPGYPTAFSEITIPRPVPVASIKWDPEAAKIENQERTFPVEITIDDPAGVRNYYGVFCDAYFKFIFEPNDPKEYEYAANTSIVLDDPLIALKEQDKRYFDDQLFDGQRVKIKFFVKILGAVGGTQRMSKVNFRLESITESYYKYYESVNLQRAVEGDPFAQPVPIYNNIENGYGIFGGLSYREVVWTNPD